MSSILNSISSGDLQVQQVPGEIPVKEDSIIDLLQNSEIEFKTCPHASNKLDDMNTGFGEGQELHYDTPCKKPELKTPLYKDNYLSEFVTEEEKAAVRNALGLYTKSDIVTEAIITLEDSKPLLQDIIAASVRQIKKSGQFFAPATISQAVFLEDGTSLDATLQLIHQSIADIQKESQHTTITSLGDVNKFLQGFNNGDSLKETLTSMSDEMVRFEYKGIIN